VSVPICVRTDHRVAVDSPDHVQPRGTALDNSRNHRFNRKLYRLCGAIDRPVRILDLGCAGGGFVRDCLCDGHVAVGIEGSDYSARWGRAEWPLLGGRCLFTADITRPFEVVSVEGPASTPLTFDVVSLWEVLEHVREVDLPVVVRNILSHLEPGGLVIASISREELPHHQTVRDESWWTAMFLKH
jgi:2-polyprenyl-3-methyl-5-hydroxy-6-metoxy-1,4-benzoquinol methylase